jgi:xanthine/uracil permease
VGLTGVRSRWVCATAGGIMLALGLFPKFAFIAASVPAPVLGGAGLVMFGMVAATGIRILAQVDYAGRVNDSLIVAVSLAAGLIPVAQPQFFKFAPALLQPVLTDPILLTAIVALVLNAGFNQPWQRGSQGNDPSGITPRS